MPIRLIKMPEVACFSEAPWKHGMDSMFGRCLTSVIVPVWKNFYFFGAIGKLPDYLKRDFMYWETSQGFLYLSFLYPLFLLFSMD